MDNLFAKKNYYTKCCDGAKGLMNLERGTVKLVYGSPPYPNAERNYGIWKANEYIEKISPFVDASKEALKDDGFLVINVKANREKHSSKESPRRSLVIERLAILLEDNWGFNCVDIEIWVKENPVPTGLRAACQDAYEQNLWFSKASKWKINLDEIRRPYAEHSIKTYDDYEYKPRSNGSTYVRKNKRISPNPKGALPINVITGGVSSKQIGHQAVQPLYLPEKYIKATTSPGDVVVDPWMGSGTTGVAALNLGRRFIGFDTYSDFVKLANSRFREINK